MANTLSVVDLVLKESQRIAHEKASFITTTDLQYDSSFKYDSTRGPNGQSIRVREPNQYTRRQGSRVMDVQDQNESTQTITAATQDGVDMRFNSAELMQSVNSAGAFDNLSKNYIEPAISVLVSGIESDYIAASTKKVWNQVGTAGTPMTDLVEPGQARAKLNQNLAPKDGNRNLMIDSVTMGGLVDGSKALFHPDNQIKEAFKEGYIARTSMATYWENERLWSTTTGSDVVGAVNQTTFAEGLETLTFDGGAVFSEGDVITLGTAKQVHPETKAAYSHNMQIVVTSVSGAVVTFTPKLYAEGAKQNVNALPVNNETLTVAGSTSTSYLQNLMYHKEAFQFVTVDLPLMDDAHKCVRTVKDGLSMRCWMGSDIRNDELLLRIDILYGMAALRPAWACRITN